MAVIAISGAGAGALLSAPATSSFREELVRSAPEKCPSAHRGLAFYSRRYNEWRTKMDFGRSALGAGKATLLDPGRLSCPRYLAQVWKRKSFAARLAFERWHTYHYDWRSWLPPVWKQIGACETGYGQRPGQWTWDSGTYQGAFGFHYGTWDVYRHRADRKAGPYPDDAYEATPRQQYEVALAVYRAVGYGAWGCA